MICIEEGFVEEIIIIMNSKSYKQCTTWFYKYTLSSRIFRILHSLTVRYCMPFTYFVTNIRDQQLKFSLWFCLSRIETENIYVKPLNESHFCKLLVTLFWSIILASTHPPQYSVFWRMSGFKIIKRSYGTLQRIAA